MFRTISEALTQLAIYSDKTKQSFNLIKPILIEYKSIKNQIQLRKVNITCNNNNWFVNCLDDMFFLLSHEMNVNVGGFSTEIQNP